jgi:hypothetical protein
VELFRFAFDGLDDVFGNDMVMQIDVAHNPELSLSINDEK